MKRLVECVPNFSEGRDRATVDAIVETIRGVAGVSILDRTSDVDHNRSVITMAGEPEAVAEAALRAVGTAAQLIDLRTHSGEHPRIGATDVVPFIPLQDYSMADCVALARGVGRDIWQRYRIPVYFYEEAATRPDRRNLESLRRGQFEGLREAAQRESERSPDIGDLGLHTSAGAVAVAARKLLVAFNVVLNTGDVAVAKRIARAIRSSSGGLPHVKAIGVELKSQGRAQVSMNLTDYEQTPLHVVFERVQREAAAQGCAIVGSEIVGLLPRRALETAAAHYLQLQKFSPDSVLENRIEEETDASPVSETAERRAPTAPAGTRGVA
jgi:glutamate formiminotransferase